MSESVEDMLATTRVLLRAAADLDDYDRTILEWAEKGILSAHYREYLQQCISGDRASPFKTYMLQALLTDIGDRVFIPPLMPKYLSQYYSAIIESALASEMDGEKGQQFVSAAIAELDRNGLLTRQFAELFRFHLKVRLSQHSSERWAHECWRICVHQLGDDNLLEGDFYFQ